MMKQFASVVSALRAWFTSLPWVRKVLPYHLHLLFGGVGILFLYELLLNMVSFSSWDTIHTLFHKIPLYALGYFGFFAGIWLTLVSKNVKYLPYGLWAQAFVILFPFENLGLLEILRSILYIGAGFAVFRYAASSYSEADTRSAGF
jgi:hypothetical protein